MGQACLLQVNQCEGSFLCIQHLYIQQKYKGLYFLNIVKLQGQLYGFFCLKSENIFFFFFFFQIYIRTLEYLLNIGTGKKIYFLVHIEL